MAAAIALGSGLHLCRFDKAAELGHRRLGARDFKSVQRDPIELRWVRWHRQCIQHPTQADGQHEAVP